MLRLLLLGLLLVPLACQAADTPTTTTPTPSKWTKLPTGCNEGNATAVSSNSAYSQCQKDSGFTFELAASVTVVENVFCRSVGCLKMFRELRSRDALACAVVPGLNNVLLTSKDGPVKCFGSASVNGNSNVIVRPGDVPSSSGSGSAGSGKTPTPNTTKPTTNSPSTSTPTPITTITEPPSSSTSPTPTSSKSGSSASSGSGSSDSKKKKKSNSTTSSPTSSGSLQQDSGNSSGLAPGAVVAIVGVSVGVFCVLVSLVFVAISTRRKARHKPSTMTTRSTHGGGTGGGSGDPDDYPYYYSASKGTRSSLVQQQQQQRPSSSWLSGSAGIGAAFEGWDEHLIAAVRLPYEKITFGELISRGGYGEVYKGTYRGQTVAIKTLLPERRRDMHQIQNFLAEVKLMAGMEHERIVQFYGVAWDSLEELSVVTEFMERGDLRTVLTEFEATGSHHHGFDRTKVQIALHVAHALTYLHSLQPAVLHRDLKSRNILLDTQLNAKLTDFGVSRECADRTMTAGVGSSLWMAPEVMMGERYGDKADVFSFGVVLSELDNHLLPYSNATETGSTAGERRRLPDPVILQMVSIGRLHVSFTNEARSEMAQIGLRCVALNPADRPTAAETLSAIHQIWRRYAGI